MVEKHLDKKSVPELEDLAAEWRKLSCAVREVAERLDYKLIWLISSFVLASILMFVYLPGDMVGEQNPPPDNLSLKLDDLLGDNGIRALTQEELDYFAKNIQLNFTVLENSYFNKKLFEAEILLTNKGKRTFPSQGWGIVFSQPSLVEPNSYPYPDGIDKPKYGVRFYFLMGNVYRMEPTSRFGTIRAGKSKFIRYISEHSNVALSDVHPNWYLEAPGLEARVIENTRGESMDFVAPYNSPAAWKRNLVIADPDYDVLSPFSATKRYLMMATEDLGVAPNPILPTPLHVQVHNPQASVNVLTNSWVIYTETRFANEAQYLSETWGMKMVLRKPGSYCISFLEEEVPVSYKDKTLPTDESYELRVTPVTNIITIKASKAAGAFYGIQSLLSLVDKDGNIPETVIVDGPRYKYRGLLLDVARNFQSKEKIFRYLNVMAMYKLNKLHFHLTDDEGWRLAIPGLEELTEIGATRCHDPTGTKCLLPFLGSGPIPGPPGSGFYTVEDYREILRYATARHIEVIPEIDLPGHSHAAIKAMMARYLKMVSRNVTEASRYLLSDLEDKSEYLSVQSFADDAINPCLRSTYTFISRVLNALYAMHRDISPLKVFNFGGDEVPAGTWEKSPVCERLRQSGVTSDLKSYLVTQISNMTSIYNLDLAAWEDGVMSEGKPMNRANLPNKNIYIYAWNNVWEWGTMKRAYEFANSGYKVIVTPATNFYLDHPSEPDPKENGLYWASRYTDMRKVFTTMPENLYLNADTFRSGKNISICEGPDKEEQCPQLLKPENIEGVQGCLFGELLRTQTITDYMLMPRMLALAERAWHEAPWESEPEKEKRMKAMNEDWTNFANTVGYKELARLDRIGFKYRIPLPGATVENNILKTSLSLPGLGIEISDDGGATWKWAQSGITPIDSSKDYLLRTSSAFGTRYSREISLFQEFNKAPSPLSSYYLVAMGVNLTFFANMLNNLL
ncbi:LOW QUALITY PROTEIN: beta-hexosaminidase-like [Physella acuta]|uniref:LOW QUALITY PROTEIN: beta-hexosaminidase-like n=1 Tax=Physella acuta TaxID=109671 RepID=UPI0027DB1DA6|nr:LOW QUALITY PROTEIN: beta-hexosaminidase-like [Physella acuta]